MRSAMPTLSLLLIAACTGGSAGSDDEPGDQQPAPDEGEPPVFSVTSKDITLAPGEEATYCFYFSTPNTETTAINRWVSDMTPGSHHMIYYSSVGQQPADGTVDDCTTQGVPVFGTQVAHEEVAFPTDDGAGKPLAQNIAPNTAGYFQMHYLNSTDAPLTANVTLKAYALAKGVAYTQTDLFATYNNDIAIGPGETGVEVSATCDVVDGKFWSISTHSHKQSVATQIKDGDAMVFESTDWEHPGTERFAAPTFFSFASGKVSWSCTYDNTGDNKDIEVVAGQSARTQEMCMATGYYFPATGPKGCLVVRGRCVCL